MNPSYNYNVSAPHLFRSGQTRASYAQAQPYPQRQPYPQLQPYAASNTNPLNSSVSRRPQEYSPPPPNPPSNLYPTNYSTYTNPYYYSTYSSGYLPYNNSSPYPNSPPYPNTSPDPRTMLNPNPISNQPPGTLPSTPPYQSSNLYPGQAFPNTFTASYGLTIWPARHAIHSISDKGLEAILVAILILAALDLILVRPHKGNLLQRGD